jgi:hypothetical protein
MSTPAPRPALKKAADAHIHPAAPGHSARSLRPATDDDLPVTAPRQDAEAIPDTQGSGSADPGQHRLSGPLRGTTSDSLRSAAKKARRRPTGKSAEKQVDLGVKVPKSLRKDLRAAAKADKKDPDVIVTALIRTWLGT